MRRAAFRLPCGRARSRRRLRSRSSKAPPVVLTGPLGNRVEQALGNECGVSRRGPGQDHEELLTAEATEHVVVAHRSRAALGDLDQDLVADRMPVRVVDALE